ncbi:zinc finger protein 16 [Drosophila grimshawi]|uniref:GH17370 n=1 Tax=Drosophila grimshawi TaxID=7222 RepID=B4JUY4_DROGR|nr:zinc finger protein 16 [Drosophila grimshawi]EDV91304.1 GH17370 [Drosophila grimshawi]
MTSGLSELLCRVCLKQDELLVDIYEHVEEQQTDLCTLLERCGDIIVEKLDSYPKYLCQECTKELLIAAKFRDKCAATEQAIKQRKRKRLDDEAASLAIGELAKDELVVDDEENTIDANDIIEFDPSEHVELYEECETEELAIKETIEAPELAVREESIEESNPIQLNANYNCDDCGAVFQQTVTLQRHIAKSHPNAVIYNCMHCGYCFTQHINLQRHSCTASLSAPSRNEGMARTRHRCVYCGKCLQSAPSLVMHLRLHNGERPFACDVCPKTFKTNGGLVVHQKRHLKLIEFECEYCGKGFVESSNLKRHIASLHTSDRPHRCTICQHSFARVYLLELHKRTHTGERPYACSWCDSSFAQLSVLRSHERIHSGERRHRCDLCQKTFSRLSQLKKHTLKSCLPVATQAVNEVVMD